MSTCVSYLQITRYNLLGKLRKFFRFFFLIAHIRRLFLIYWQDNSPLIPCNKLRLWNPASSTFLKLWLISWLLISAENVISKTNDELSHYSCITSLNSIQINLFQYGEKVKDTNSDVTFVITTTAPDKDEHGEKLIVSLDESKPKIKRVVAPIASVECSLESTPNGTVKVTPDARQDNSSGKRNKKYVSFAFVLLF